MKLSKTLCRYLFIIAMWLSSCQKTEVVKTQPWSTEMVSGATFELIDDKSIGVYGFSADGAAPLTVGEKDGPFAAPLLFWRVEGDTLILSETPGSEGQVTFRLVSREGDVLTLLTKSGRQERYRYSRR